MSVVSALVLYAVIWFLCLFVALPMNIRSQEEEGDVAPGTPASAPSNPKLKVKAKWATISAALIWIPLSLAIEFRLITIEDIDYFSRWGDGRYG
ncbi:MAG: DUF1467 family protein [Albidovulum sp.]|nr:DUF1467 family protein [Albidovulum sp.]